MADVLSIGAPAKINLDLRVHGKRDDGFHEIETRMCPLSLADKLTVKKTTAGGLAFATDDGTLPTGEENLVVKAARGFEAATGIEVHASVRLEKVIPPGAGLGGGSSDAAAMLVALNALEGTEMEMSALARIAGTIGSDVPFFLYRRACVCRGRGEVIEPLHGAGLPCVPVVLLKPPFAVSTPQIYRRWAESTDNPAFDYGPQKTCMGELSNGLERPAFEKFPVLGHLKAWLRDREEVEGALMSGSGAALYALLAEEESGRGVIEDARLEFGPSLWGTLCEARPGF